MENVTLNAKEQKRAWVLPKVIAGELTAREGGEALGLSERQVRRLIAAYREGGVAALAHGNRGRTPACAIPSEDRARVLALARGAYAGLNHSHLTEKLAEEEGIEIGRSTVRRILLEEGIRSPRKRRAARHRSRRPRRERAGMLLQIDASPHAWLGDRGPRLALVAGIDDATGEVPGAVFRPTEDAAGYFLLMRGIVLARGIPLAVYHDRHGIFRRLPNERPTLEERFAGGLAPTQFGRLLGELGVESIAARSPQAKGRIERLFGTFQDRLVAELRLAGAASLGEAEEVLAGFLPRYNARFAVGATEPGACYRALPEGFAPERLFCFTYERTVGMDNTVRLGEHRIQVLPGPRRRSYARARVEVHEHLDGSLAVHHEGALLVSQRAPDEAPLIRARSGRLGAAQLVPPSRAAVSLDPPPAPAAPETESGTRQPVPSPDHPWRRGYKRHRLTESPDG